jgi:hypothetical protein
MIVWVIGDPKTCATMTDLSPGLQRSMRLLDQRRQPKRRFSNILDRRMRLQAVFEPQPRQALQSKAPAVSLPPEIAPVLIQDQGVTP